MLPYTSRAIDSRPLASRAGIASRTPARGTREALAKSGGASSRCPNAARSRSKARFRGSTSKLLGNSSSAGPAPALSALMRACEASLGLGASAGDSFAFRGAEAEEFCWKRGSCVSGCFQPRRRSLLRIVFSSTPSLQPIILLLDPSAFKRRIVRSRSSSASPVGRLPRGRPGSFPRACRPPASKRP